MSFYRHKIRALQSFTSYEKDPEIPERIKKLLNEESHLTNDERNFCHSVLSYWNNHYLQITTKQYQNFCRIEKKYCPENLKAEEEFSKQWEEDPIIRENFRICCEYYTRERYFFTTTDKFSANKDYIPTFDEYERICCNKYAIRLLDSYRSSPKFNVGDMVQVIGKSYLEPGAKCGIVLVTGIAPTRAVKNATRYKIQDIKTSRQFEVEEKYIRKLRVKKNEAC